MKAKRMLCLLIILAMLVSISACGEGGDASDIWQASRVADSSLLSDSSAYMESDDSSEYESSPPEEASVTEKSQDEFSEESSEAQIEESSEEPSEESSAPEADYIVEDMHYAGYTLISRVVDDDNVEQKRLYGLSLYDYLDNNNKILLQPEFDIIYAGLEHNMIIAVKLNTEIYGSDHSEVYVYNGNLQCIGKYYSIYYGGAYRGRSTEIGRAHV